MNRKVLKKVSRLFGPALLQVTRLLLPLLARRNSDPVLVILKIVGMGDTVLMLPVIRLIKRTFPEFRIAAVATPATRPFLADCQVVDTLLPYDILGADRGFKGLARILLALRRKRPKAYLDFEQNVQLTPLFGAVSGAPIRIGLRHPDHDRGRLFTHPVAYDDRERIIRLFHQVYVNLCVAMGRSPVSFQEMYGYTIPLNPDAAAKAEKWRVENTLPGEILVGIHAGSGGTNVYRRWPIERFTELIGRLLAKGNYRVVLTGGPEEAGLLSDLKDRCDDHRVLSAAGFSFKEFVALLGTLDCYLSNDTGPLHIGPWVGTPTIGLFGPEVPGRYGSLHGNCVSIHKPFPCSPCIQVHKGVNPPCSHEDKGACVKQITVDEVFKHVTALAESHNGAQAGSLGLAKQERDVAARAAS